MLEEQLAKQNAANHSTADSQSKPAEDAGSENETDSDVSCCASSCLRLKLMQDL